MNNIGRVYYMSETFIRVKYENIPEEFLLHFSDHLNLIDMGYNTIGYYSVNKEDVQHDGTLGPSTCGGGQNRGGTYAQ